jgi:8-oxo-dGTP pyrophosphatase MutT (NUDIX family)
MIMKPAFEELRLPISVKGVVLRGHKVLLLKNERDEWELPGGKLDPGEQPEDCVRREIKEEIGWESSPDRLLNAWVYEIRRDRLVFVLTYGCRLMGATTAELVVSHEHREARLFPIDQVADLNMPLGYKEAISLWVNDLEVLA